MNLEKVLESLEIPVEDYEIYPGQIAKLNPDLAQKPQKGKMVLVTAMNPTPFGEGKTTMNIGLSMALNQLGYRSISTLREPSLGPVFGMKGGATGGNKASVKPADRINLHFTGDFHAISSAHNLLSAMIDNHLYHGNQLQIDPKTISWPSVLDMNDRSLRQIELLQKDYQRSSRFDITAASEIMAILALATSMQDLKARLAKIQIGYNRQNQPVLAQDLQAVEAMAILLQDALKPNLVLTSENTPALIHAGPFANIAHGCNSVLASKIALAQADFVISEAGFGADLGAEKFLNIKRHLAQIETHAIVFVVTLRSLKYQVQIAKKDLQQENPGAIREAFQHILAHLGHLRTYQIPIILTLNRFEDDHESELAVFKDLCQEQGLDFAFSQAYSQGSQGSMDLAHLLLKRIADQDPGLYLYDKKAPLEEKIAQIAHRVYGADGVVYSPQAQAKLASYQDKESYVCMAKPQYSLSDQGSLRNVPKNFKIQVQDLELAAGADFVIVLLGKMMRMPGLAKHPRAEKMLLDEDGSITGLD